MVKNNFSFSQNDYETTASESDFEIDEIYVNPLRNLQDTARDSDWMGNPYETLQNFRLRNQSLSNSITEAAEEGAQGIEQEVEATPQVHDHSQQNFQSNQTEDDVKCQFREPHPFKLMQVKSF